MDAKHLLNKAGADRDVHWEILTGGRNNRVYKLVSKQKAFVLKSYFHSDKDSRDRLSTEFSFSSFLWQNGIRQIAEPILWDSEKHIALFGFIKGRKLLPYEVSEKHVLQALEFIIGLNRFRNQQSASAFSPASEACFNLDDHFSSVEKRLQRFEGLAADNDLVLEAVRFVKKNLRPAFDRIKEMGLKKGGQPYNIDIFVTGDDKILSPSDFGFHNALLDKDSTLFFFDFEYAGWDDPAKMICDFFCQPDIPAPDKYMSAFIERMSDASGNDLTADSLEKRVKFLIPLYRIKWCCIILNIFLSRDAQRIRFASYNTDQRTRQLEKARGYYNRYMQ